MFITSLSEMEQIVASRSDLHWEGWDVVRYKKNPNAQFDVTGVFRNGSWHKRYVFPITEDGWSIPHSIGNRDA